MPIPQAYRNRPNAPWVDDEPEPDPDPDAEYERIKEKRIEERIREEAEHVTEDTNE